MQEIIRLHSVVFLFLAALTQGRASADELAGVGEKASSHQPADSNGAKYGGVAPGASANNPLPAPPTEPTHLIWTGFQPTPTGSRVFLQTTKPVDYELKEGAQSKAGHSTLTVLLRGCRIHMANNRRKLDTRAFATPVQGISAKQRRGDVELSITLREPASASPAVEAGPGGTQFLYLAFPPGKAEEIPVGKRAARAAVEPSLEPQDDGPGAASGERKTAGKEEK